MIYGFIFFLILVLIGLLVFLYFGYRKSVAQAKSFERGLKMVPFRIELPPISDDVQGEKDNRDITDESLSKALSLYNILAGAYKSKGGEIYGQRHIALEIIMHKGRIYFYVAAPLVLRATVEQAVLSSYPTATITEAAEHNIFSKSGKISGTYGGELVLTDDYSKPIATYLETKKDGMVSLLNGLASMGSNDGAALQIMIRPTDGSWTKHVKSEAKSLKDGDKGGGFTGAVKSMASDLTEALWKTPESPGDDGGPSDISGSDQDLIESMEQKIKYAGFETLIRVVASSDSATKAQQASSKLVSVFSVFDAAGRNGFKFVPATDIEKFIDAYVLRMFPVNQKDNILNSVELATIFHLPDQRNIPTSKLKKSNSKATDAPTDIMDEGVLLGYNIFRSTKTPIYLSDNDRRRHVYIVGQTGVGKSVFMENIATQDIMAGKGFAYIDPHGDGAEYLMSVIPPERVEDVIYFSPSDMEYPMGLNLFEADSEDQKDFLIQEAINMLYKLYDPNHQGIVGPRMETIFRNSAKVLMASPQGGTFIEIPKLLSDQDFLNERLKHVTDRAVLDFWLNEVPNSKKSNDYGEVVSWVSSKFGAFLSNNMMRNIIGQTHSSFNLRQIMDEQKLLIVNLSKGKTGDLNSKLLGMIFVMRFQAAAMSRADMPESERKDFSLFVDEFQNFSTDSFATILSEARKFRLNLIVANQFTSQLDEEVRDAVFGNVGSMVSFRVGVDDAEGLSKQFQPIFSADDLANIPNFNAAAKLMINNVPSQPFSIKSMPPLAESNPDVLASMMRYAAVKNGRPRAEVEKDIFSRMYGDTPLPKIPTTPKPQSHAATNPSKSPVGNWLKQRPSTRAATAPASSIPSRPQAVLPPPATRANNGSVRAVESQYAGASPGGSRASASGPSSAAASNKDRSTPIPAHARSVDKPAVKKQNAGEKPAGASSRNSQIGSTRKTASISDAKNKKDHDPQLDAVRSTTAPPKPKSGVVFVPRHRPKRPEVDESRLDNSSPRPVATKPVKRSPERRTTASDGTIDLAFSKDMKVSRQGGQLKAKSDDLELVTATKASEADQKEEEFYIDKDGNIHND